MYIDKLHSIAWIYHILFANTTHFDYCNIWLCFKIENEGPLTLLLFFKIVLAIIVPSHFHIILELFKIACEDFDRDCVKSIDHLWENFCLNNIESFN